MKIPDRKKALEKMGLKTDLDLLYHFPTRYGNTSEQQNISGLIAGETAVIFGKIRDLKIKKGWTKRVPIAEGYIEDSTGRVKLIWFHQPYIAKMFPDGSSVRIEGKVSARNGQFSLLNPKIERAETLEPADALFSNNNEHHLYPIYPESKGVTSLWFYHTIQKILKSEVLEKIQDPIPEYILNTYKLPTLATALIWIHAPLKEADALAARKRFAFEEVFLIQLQKKREKIDWEKEPAFLVNKNITDLKPFIDRFPFQATEAQMKAIENITTDFNRGYPMARLLEGDVGSGKTAVAAATAYAVITSRPKNQNFGHLQVAYMAPTEILAKQHFESFIQYFTYLGINIGLITGKECRKFPSKTNPKDWTNISRTQLLKWVENGEIPILIGTHALIQKSVEFKHLAYVIIDEQHRFGTSQRQKLAKKKEIHPHLLSMTATPIPRTLALTVFGDLDLTLLDQMPAGRKPIITEIVLPSERTKVYEKIKTELEAGRQAYIICPRINEPDPEKPASAGWESAIIAKSVTEEAERLEREIFPEYKDQIGILHSQMLPADKEYVMQEFKNGKIKILVATSVVEVGVNVPNATIILIEGAERFGLAQLHQLRGRVIRSNHQAYCFALAESKSEKTLERLKAFKTAKNGFELAEYDLSLRGAGELSGAKQWGVSDIGMEALRNLKMVEAARTEAEYLLKNDPDLEKYPVLKEKLTQRKDAEIHFE